ncbi:MAG: HK97 family phage prohead protease [Bacteroidales bacterium]|nr:HK97 family phage prohead protease [Bacteroidales bacterium]
MKIVLCDSNTINSYGFRTSVPGINLERFNKNPVMLYNHDPLQVIGKWENVTVVGDTLQAEPVFDLNDPFAAEIARKVEEGFIKGCSMGLMITQITKTKGIDTATQSLLLEASIVSIPADENALVVYADEKQEKKLSINEFNKLFYNMETKDIDTSQLQVELSEKNSQIKTLQAELTAKTDIISDLTAQVNELQKDLAEREYHEGVACVDKAIADGKIPENVKNICLAFYLSNPEDTKTLLEALNPVAPSISLSQMVNAPKTEKLTWDELDHKPGALQKLKAENFEEFKRLYREKFNREWDRF